MALGSHVRVTGWEGSGLEDVGRPPVPRTLLVFAQVLPLRTISGRL